MLRSRAFRATRLVITFCLYSLSGGLKAFPEGQSPQSAEQRAPLEKLTAEGITAFANIGWFLHSSFTVPVAIPKEVVAKFFSGRQQVSAKPKDHGLSEGEMLETIPESATEDERKLIEKHRKGTGLPVGHFVRMEGVIAFGSQLYFWRLPYVDKLLLYDEDGNQWLITKQLERK